MRIGDAKRLKPGDVVTWNDPDDGACTRTGEVKAIESHGGMVWITWADGSDLECFARELSTDPR